MYTSTDASADTAKSTVVLIYNGSSVVCMHFVCVSMPAACMFVCVFVCLCVCVCVCVRV